MKTNIDNEEQEDTSIELSTAGEENEEELKTDYLKKLTETNENQLTANNRIDKILTSFKSLIDKNNGIRKENILKLVIPLGVDYSSIDPTWLTTIDSYGSSRGQVAHNSFSVQQQLDRNGELNNLGFVLKGIEEMDIKIQKLSSRRRLPF